MSMELLYQAIKSGIKADIAIGLRSQIELWQDLHLGKEIPDVYKIVRIVDSFADFTRNNSNQSESSKINAMINKFKAEQGKNQEDKKGFKYKNKVQCKACKMFGHDMNDDQICRSGAQHYWLSKFAASEETKQIYEANANRYKEANKKHFVSYFNSNNVCLTEYEHQDQCKRAYMDNREGNSEEE